MEKRTTMETKLLKIILNYKKEMDENITKFDMENTKLMGYKREIEFYNIKNEIDGLTENDILQLKNINCGIKKIKEDMIIYNEKIEFYGKKITEIYDLVKGTY